MTAAWTASTVAPAMARTSGRRHVNSSESDASPAKRPTALDPLSDGATLTLIRRTLCSQQLKDKGRDVQAPIEEQLPALTSRSDVDLQLYAFLAIVMREYVQSWYGRITTDETLMGEVVRIIAHCTTALEQRLGKVDLESLVLDEIPDLLDRHATAHRIAHQQSSRGPVRVNPREVYHSLCPMPALSPVPQPYDPTMMRLQAENEMAYRQLLVQAVLAVLLPPEELENPCLTALVCQILSELIIGGIVANKASQPWLLYEAICITTKSLKEEKARRAAERVMATGPGKNARQPQNLFVQRFFVSIIHFGILFFGTIRLCVTILTDSIRLPPRAKTASASKVPSGQDTGSLPDKVPVLSFKIWPCLGNLVRLNETRPWLSGFLSLLRTAAVHGLWPVAGLDSPLDRLLSHHIQSLFDPSLLPPILRSLRGALFPNNSPGPSTLAPPSSEQELFALRRRAAGAIWDLLPKPLGRAYFSGGGFLWRPGDVDDARLLDDIEGLLMVVEDEYCNKHVMYGVLELVLVRLMPEISDKGVVELWEERLGSRYTTSY